MSDCNKSGREINAQVIRFVGDLPFSLMADFLIPLYGSRDDLMLLSSRAKPRLPLGSKIARVILIVIMVYSKDCAIS